MKLTITPDHMISEIQAEINAVYPYLTLNFFTLHHRKNEMSSMDLLINADTYLKSVDTGLEEGSVAIHPEVTVAELEKKFRQRFGLSAQVFRKCGEAWLETTSTDGWTLGEQNKEGQALTHMRQNAPKA